jgi:electron transfer flavoprotein-quinone oxidoreductase
MEHFDVAIVGGGTAGFSALQQLSNLGRQAILIEAGKTPGTKNVSGGILYSKMSKFGKLYNVEDVFGQDIYEQAPLERRITKYVLHATSNDKVFSIDLTPVHEYQSNGAYSVLLSKLIPWLAKRANENAEKQGGGVVTGVHVKNVKWENNKTIVESDELEPFAVKAIIAADGVNSELASISEARPKFRPNELYQGVKIIAKLPEELLEKRFDLQEKEGAAHLFAGDITLNHIGGGFLYTNRDTISLGAVYHYDSLLDSTVEPFTLVNSLLRNPFISEFVRDEVPTLGILNDQLSKEDQLKARFAISKLTKSWNELRNEYYSRAGRVRLREGGRYKSDDEIKARLDWIRNELSDRYKTIFVSDYVELEYSAKLVPDGKRCRMKRPYSKNILFVGDAAGRGIFVGPKIEGLNVGIDDAVRAANCVSRSIERNNFDEEYLGEFYTKSIEDSPYTRDMMEIDKEYLKLFMDAAKDVPKDLIKARYGIIFKLMSSGLFRGLAVGFANILGYDRLLPMIETTETYVQVPTELAERFGKSIRSTYSCTIPTIAERIAKLKYNDDIFSHIKVEDPTTDFMKKMVNICPTKCYTIEQEKVMLQHEGCIECGSCALETGWKHPRGEKGIEYRYG